MKKFGMMLFAAVALAIICGNCDVIAADAKDVKGAVQKPAVAKDVNDVAKVAEKPEPDVALATLNGKKIMRSEIDEAIYSRMPNIKAMPEDTRKQYLGRMRQQALDSIIVEKLLEEQVKAKKIVVNDAEVMAKVNEIAANNSMTIEQLKERLKALGKDLNGFKKDIEKGMAYEKLFVSFAGSEVTVTDADVKKYYDENINNFKNDEQVRASHILVKLEADATDEQKAEAKKKIDALLVRVKAGEDFAKLAQENSDCPSKSKGGDLDFFEKDKMVKPFSDAAYAMKVGDISDVVETRFGYHIIKVTDKKAAGVQTFEEVKTNIKGMLENQKRSNFARKYIDELKAKAKIEYSEAMKPKAPAAPKPQEIKVEGSKK